MDVADYIIYEVLHNGIPVYIGSGKSGCSHNPELNKLFFEDADNVVVQILRDCLTKEESLEYEKEYIQAIHPVFNKVHTRRNKKVGKYWK